MGEAIDISWCEDEAAAELKGIHPKLVLMMPGRPGAIAALEIVAASHVQQIRRAQISDGISLAILVNEQGKSDSRFFAENPCIVAVAQADGSEGSALIQEGLLVFAQLRDVLAAKNSAIVAEKNDDCRLALPQRTQTDFSAIGVRENDVCQLPAESFLHVDSSLTRRYSSVKDAPSLLFPGVWQPQRS